MLDLKNLLLWWKLYQIYSWFLKATVLFCSAPALDLHIFMCNTRIKYFPFSPAVNKEKGLSTLCCKHFSFFLLRLKYHNNWSCQLLLKQAVYRPLFPRLYLLAFFASKMMETVQLLKNLPPSLLLSYYHQNTLFLSSASVALFVRYFPMDWRACE